MITIVNNVLTTYSSPARVFYMSDISFGRLVPRPLWWENN